MESSLVAVAVPVSTILTGTECAISSTSSQTSDEEDLGGAFSNLGLIEPGECISHVKRNICPRCKRPAPVCWCRHLPIEKISTATRVIILQHPNEVKRNVRTAPMLEVALSNCFVIRGRHFGRHSLMREVYANESHTFVLYPSSDAIDVEDLPTGEGFNLIVIDGTWNQAKSLYFGNKELHSLKKVFF
ncbi:DTW domain-containing protein 2-like [Tropilaelaps mercedesae]|uniref:tRNA-uridine aminocarboxypropyltransferase n=1 Tax=Tropilaelaps mercedesae TaxID=418985 RepID=A0A1V9XWC1_9ACAR|nr:DTW domain-containing protein 2-like [Tropilaelaps mercedesae]